MRRARAALTQSRAELYRRSFSEYAKAAWPLIDSAPLIWGWHADAICDHLQAVQRGHIKKLIINCPPGLAKSTFVSALFPAWWWAIEPNKQFLTASYSQDLAKRDAQKSRIIVRSDWFKEHFRGDSWDIDSERDKAADYWNTKLGRRVAVGVGGGATGQRGHGVLCDDPIKALDIYSDAIRLEAIRWWDETMSNRINDPANAFFVIIMQRLHEDDLTGHVLKKEMGYEHLMLPSEFDPARKSVTSIGWEDPRKEPGELLFPALMNKNYLSDQKKSLGTLGYAGQHQQSPEAIDGNLFKRGWWRFFSSDVPSGDYPRPSRCYKGPARHITLKEMECIEMHIDPNMGATKKEEQKTGDRSNAAIAIWGKKGPDRFLLDIYAAPDEYMVLKQRVRDMRKKWPQVRRVVIEKKASGPAMINEFRAEFSGVIDYDPGSDSKITRASLVSPQVESGNVYLLDGAPWLDSYVGELSKFPNGRRDDQVDVTSQALIVMGSTGDVDRLVALGRNMHKLL